MADSFESALIEGLLDETETRSGLRGVSDVHIQCTTASLTNAKLGKDIAKLSPTHQTSSLESFHSVIIHLAPKSIAGNAVQVNFSLNTCCNLTTYTHVHLTLFFYHALPFTN